MCFKFVFYYWVLYLMIAIPVFFVSVRVQKYLENESLYFIVYYRFLFDFIFGFESKI
jgi:hypothetical protein